MQADVRWRRAVRLIPWLLLTATVFGACAAKGSSQDAYGRGGMVGQEAARSRRESSSGGSSISANRLLVRTASIEVTVAAVLPGADEAVRITEQAGGYVHESSTEKDGRANFELRVPAAQLDAVLNELGKLGEEKSRYVSTEDVTDKVTDLEAELANKRALRDRLRLLLERAKDVKDVLAVETELTRVQTDIDSLEAKLKTTREDIAYSAIKLTLSPPAPPKESRILGPLGYLWVGTKWVVTKLFVIREGSDD